MVHLYAAIPPVYFDRDFRQSPHMAVLYFHDNRFVVQHLLALQELLSPRVRGLVPRSDPLAFAPSVVFRSRVSVSSLIAGGCVAV